MEPDEARELHSIGFPDRVGTLHFTLGRIWWEPTLPDLVNEILKFGAFSLHGPNFESDLWMAQSIGFGEPQYQTLTKEFGLTAIDVCRKLYLALKVK